MGEEKTRAKLGTVIPNKTRYRSNRCRFHYPDVAKRSHDLTIIDLDFGAPAAQRTVITVTRVER